MTSEHTSRFDVDEVLRLDSRPGPILVGRLTSGALGIDDRLVSTSDADASVRVLGLELHVSPNQPDRRAVMVGPDLGVGLSAGASFWVVSRDIAER